jgi:hypothetical protein
VSATDRPKRPPPQRTQPIRSWSTLFAVPTSDGDAATPDAEAREADIGPTEPQATGLNDVVSRSVDLGYRVIDEYIRQGQKAAQRLNDRSYGTQAMAGDLQDLAMRMTQYASDFAAVWVEFIQRAAGQNGAAPAPAGGYTGPADMAATSPTPATAPAAAAPGVSAVVSPPSDPTRVRIEILATQPTEVSLDLRPGAAQASLLVHALRAPEADKPRLTEVSVERGVDGEPPRLRIRVPPNQPPGIYSGLIIDASTSLPAGSVTVRIADA